MYATQADIPIDGRSLINLTDDAGTGAVNVDVLNAAIGRADRTIDAYLRGQYIVPFDPVPPEVRSLSADLTWYLLEQRRTMVTEASRQAHQDALRMLKDLQSGRAVLSTAGQTSSIEQPPGRIVTNKTANHALFPKSVLDRF